MLGLTGTARPIADSSVREHGRGGRPKKAAAGEVIQPDPAAGQGTGMPLAASQVEADCTTRSRGNSFGDPPDPLSSTTSVPARGGRCQRLVQTSGVRTGRVRSGGCGRRKPSRCRRSSLRQTRMWDMAASLTRCCLQSGGFAALRTRKPGTRPTATRRDQGLPARAAWEMSIGEAPASRHAPRAS